MTVQDGARLEPIAGNAHIHAAPPLHRPPAAHSAIDIPADVHNIDVRVEVSDFSTNKLHQFNADFNSVLKSIRIADQALAEIETKADQIKSEMQTFLKMYPPYPPESEERVRLLKNYAAIRNQIEQFALPQDNFAAILLGNGPANDLPEKYEIKISDNIIEGQLSGPHQNLDSVALPELSMGSDDKQIAVAGKTLEKLTSHLTGKRFSLSQDVKRLIESVR
jgi:hypothetical protein